MGEDRPGPIRRMFGAGRRARAAAEQTGPVDPGTSGTAPAAPARLREEDLLLQSPLFDAEWYELVAGVGGDRETLVRHYLSRPVGQRVSPHPLFDPDWFRHNFSGDVGERDPFLVYLRRQAWSSATHPLFSASYYRRTVPAAKRHPYGPLGHYVEFGAPAGAAGHRWLQGDGTAPATDVRALVLDSRRAWMERRDRAASGAALQATPDWEGEQARERDPQLTSVVIDTGSDWESTARAVRRVVEGAGARRVQVVLIARASDPLTSLVLDALTVRHPQVEVLHQPIDHGPAQGIAAAVPRLRGSTLLLLDPVIDLDPGWLDPLLAPLDDEGVLGSQPLLLRPDRTVRCAGLAFAEEGEVHEFLQGFPVEDAEGVERLSFQALSGACLLLRTAHFASVRGLDAAVPPAEQDVDLCLRLTGAKSGRFAVRVEATAVQHDAPSRPRVRSGAPQVAADHDALWASRGFTIVHGEPSDQAGGPALVRVRPVVTEGDPRLRWAIKNPATTGPYGDRWGDTHFAEALASALRGLGQEVVIDRRDAFHRPTGRHDDVNLVLRGLTRFEAVSGTETVTLGWVISHPDEVTPDELRTWDRALAASTHWAAQRTREWGIEIEALLQACDPARFRPDLAVPDSGHPVLFVGSSRKQYRPMVRDAVEQGLPLAVYGTEWEGLLPAEFLAATYLPNDQLGAAYGAAGVVLNDHWEDMRVDGFLSNRLFDAVASGARVITDDVKGLEGLFGRSVQVARTPRDLVELSSAPDPDALFGDIAERSAVAGRVRRDHSFTARARRLLDLAVAARVARGLRI